MDDNQVAVLLEQLLTDFRTFGEGLSHLQSKVDVIERNTNGLIADMDLVKPTLVQMNQRLNNVEVRLDTVDNRLDAIDNRLDTIETRLDTMDNRLDVIETRMDTVDNHLATIDSRLGGIETEIIKLNPDARATLKQAR
jgi:chromosome segregation ATPase